MRPVCGSLTQTWLPNNFMMMGLSSGVAYKSAGLHNLAMREIGETKLALGRTCIISLRFWGHVL